MKKVWFSMIIISVCISLILVSVVYSEQPLKDGETMKSKAILDNVPK